MIRQWFGRQQPRRPSLFRKLAVESLERREVLTGINFSAGNLTLLGDAGANNVVDLDVNGSRSVKITANGTNLGTFGGVINVSINLLGGNDTVTLYGAGSIGGDLTVNLGSGANNFYKAPSATSVRIGGNLSVSSGTGNDRAYLDGIRVGRNININLSAGPTAICLTDTSAAGNASITTYAGASPQYVKLGDVGTPVAFGGSLLVNLGGATSHRVYLNNLSTGASASIFNIGVRIGSNTVAIGTTAAVHIGGSLTYADGTGDATVVLAQLTVGGAFNYSDTGGGSDTLTLGSAVGAGFSVAGVTNINTGAGADVVTVGATKATFAGTLNVNLGTGDDSLTISAAAFGLAGNNLLFDGGPGAGDFWRISRTAIPGIDPLTAATALVIYNFEGPNTPTV